MEEIRKMNNQIAIDGIRIYKDEVIIIEVDKITIISVDDLTAEKIKRTDKRISLVTKNSEEIGIII